MSFHRWTVRLLLATATFALLGGSWPTIALAAPTEAVELAGTRAALLDESATLKSSFGLLRAVEALGLAAVTPAATEEATERVAEAAAPTSARIGLQAGHWQAAKAPPPLNTQTGARGGGKTEAEVTLAIAQAAASALRAAGATVDILPTVIPKGYAADLVVAIHTDGATSTSARGFFVDRSTRARTAAAETKLASALTEAYKSVGIPNVNRSTANSRQYYGYYSVAPTTPMALIETGFLTSPVDRQVIVDRPNLSGEAIAKGILSFLRSSR